MHPEVFKWFRDTIPTMLGDAPAIPFHETLGKMLNQTGLPDMWCTLEVDSSGMQRLTIGHRGIFRESGTVTVVFVHKSGLGVEALLVAGQRLADVIRGDDGGPGYYQRTLNEPNGVIGTLRIENVSSADPAPYEDGNWMLCSVVCAYTYDSVRGAAL